jgi:hypothetical protein
MEVIDHLVHAEQVRGAAVCVGTHELAERATVAVFDTFVGIEEEHPVRREFRGRREQTIAVLGIVPASVARSPRVAKHRSHHRFCLEHRAGLVGAAVVERNDAVGKTAHRLEVAGKVVDTVPCR